MVLLDVEEFFFQMFLPFMIIYSNSHHLENCVECGASNNPQHFLSVLVKFRVE